MKKYSTFFYIGVVGLGVSFIINILIVLFQDVPGMTLIVIWTPIYLNFLFFLIMGVYQNHWHKTIDKKEE